ncbi:hypothetical protein VHEMI07996 [[Torrubiella] hemipterigena]|uniref:Peptidase S53 domain-containing protein n=1 Tax=[Torrubiella] hemipterigena TaxID=1531966 RepID=A0A0A1T598_9HYPO|nr:hypothetical protein VHEMI07996 [[Torrubiella] hemipterigena]
MPSALPGFLILATATGMAMAAPGLDSATANLLGPHRILEEITAPASWLTVGNPSPSSIMKMQIGLKQKNIEGLLAKLNDISDHESPNYGKWLSKEEVEAFTAPDKGVAEKVLGWLKSAGIPLSAISQPTPDWIHFDVSVDKVEELLKTKYHLFKQEATGRTITRTTQYQVPQSLLAIIDTIQPTINFAAKRPEQPVAKAALSDATTRQGQYIDLAQCSHGADPACIRTLYNVDYRGTGRSSVGAICYNNDDASHADLHTFLTRYDTSIPSSTDYRDVNIDSSVNPSINNGEPILDIEMQVSLGYPNQASLIHATSTGTYDDILGVTNYLNTNDGAPHVVSASYDSAEPSTGNQYTTRICNEFAKATSRGITVLVSSGDFGVAGIGGSCGTKFAPTFPSGCPYITTVGATTLSSNGQTETAAKFNFIKNGYSAGGFSSIFSAPDWQANDTATYIQNFAPASYNGKYNKAGRGFPDIALLGTNIKTVYKGDNYLSEGTSASAPMLAGLLSQINDDRLANGKSLLGFINKRLYTDNAVRAALRDVTTGNNPGCGTNGFSASTGWDPVTGLGSINFAALRKALSN